MSDNLTGPELFQEANSYVDDINDGEAEYVSNAGVTVDNRMLYATLAAVRATQAQIAILATIAENMHDFPPYEMEAWREVLPLPPLKECKGKNTRRPECAERHTEDCNYADPVPEPKHVLLPVGTRVLVSDWERDDDDVLRLMNPQAGRIAGYDMSRSKYQWQREWGPGRYSETVSWAFADNRVVVHPEGPKCPAGPEPVKQEPTGPRMYVKNYHGKQGYVLSVRADEKDESRLWFYVQWFSPGAQPVWKMANTLTLIAESQVDRCENGQTADECGSGENQCELCLQAEDEEGDEIEESMGLR